MAIKRWLSLILLVLLGGLIFIFRNRLINHLQLRLIRSMAGKAVVDNRQLLRDPAFAHHGLYHLKGMDRLWPHRVNSLERFRYLYPEFPGFECDIQFLPDATGGTLSIGHDAPGPDRFTEYLEADSSKKKLFWLDLKNIDEHNIDAFGSRLESLERQYAIRDRVILECYDTLAAAALHRLGYLTALNYSAIDHSKPNTDFISAESVMQPALLKDFPNSKQINWDISFGDAIDRSNLLKQANDTNLLVCLLNIKSPGYR
jgi:hypothetical protein